MSVEAAALDSRLKHLLACLRNLDSSYKRLAAGNPDPERARSDADFYFGRFLDAIRRDWSETQQAIAAEHARELRGDD